MALYELRTYSLYVGKLAEVLELYRKEGWPAVSRHAEGRLVGYFVGDVGAMNQIVHLWKFEDDAERRRFWEAVFADEAFMAFANKLRPLIRSQENKLLRAAPWDRSPEAPGGRVPRRQSCRQGSPRRRSEAAAFS